MGQAKTRTRRPQRRDTDRAQQETLQERRARLRAEAEAMAARQLPPHERLRALRERPGMCAREVASLMDAALDALE